MADQIMVVFVEPDKSLSCRGATWTNARDLQDEREVIAIFILRPNPGAGAPFFKDEVAGHDCFGLRNSAQGIQVTVCDSQPAFARDVTIPSDTMKSATIKDWPAKLNQAAISAPVRYLGYDVNASDYDDLLDDARALDPLDCPDIIAP